MNFLEQDFERRVRSALSECHQLGYHPRDFEGMLSNSSAVLVTRRLVTSGNIQAGLNRLAEMGRLDLSVESIMLETVFESLFEKPLRDAAQWRLNQVSPHYLRYKNP